MKILGLLDCLLFLLILESIKCATSNKADYYEQLITEEIQNSQNYVAPERNIEFELGANLNNSDNYGTFDFIIIGSGSTGSVIATRLSEVQNWKILLLEAGGEETDFAKIPALASYLQKSDLNWGYKTAPQEYYCRQFSDNRCPAPRGKAVGGSSVINGVHYVRGNKDDFNKWAEIASPDWSYDNVLPYFKKSENSQVNGDEGYHGKTGYLNIEHTTPDLETLSNFIEANQELGRNVTDYNGHQQSGVSRFQYTTKNGERHSIGTAFLSNARKRENFNVLTKALVTKIIIDESSKKAQGVYFVKNNKKFKAFATKEVILSAGAYNSPQLLLISGIGPKKHLEEIGVKVIEDLPSVGQNLIDHVGIGLRFRINHTLKAFTLREKIEQFLKGSGPLTKATSADAVCFDVNVPKYEIMYNEVGNDTLLFLGLLHHPKSRGTMKLKSKDPIDFPLISPNIHSKEEDKAAIFEAIKYIFQLSRTRGFKKINATYIEDNSTPCGTFQENSLNFWDCFLKYQGHVFLHTIGSTRMGVDNRDSVVDSNAKVHGIKSLRVADAGVIPISLSGHIHAAAVMVGEQVSDKIKRKYEIVKSSCDHVKVTGFCLITMLMSIKYFL